MLIFRTTIFCGVTFSLSGPSTKIYHWVHTTATSMEGLCALVASAFMGGTLFCSMQSELESLQQSGARTEATMQSLRQQLAEAEGRRHTPCSCTELQTDIGRLRTELKEKVCGVRLLLHVMCGMWSFACC